MSAPMLNHAHGVTSTTIASSGTASAAVDYMYALYGGFALPAAFTGVAITFTVCSTLAGTYQTLKKADGSGNVSVTVAAGNSYPLPTELAGWTYFKFVSGSAEAALRTIIVTRKG